jgi:hypothetical protein
MSLLLDMLRASTPGLRREKLKQLIGALGHEPGWAQKIRAELLAKGNRRADRVTGHAVTLAKRAGMGTLAGLRIMEFGLGHLLSVPVVYWLAGAREVVATDYYAILDLSASRRALLRADTATLIGKLAEIAEPTEIEARLRALLAMKRWTLSQLEELGIRYVAPLDASRPIPSLGSFDCVSSTSVMEHVPTATAGDILSNLHDRLVPGGAQIHNIHLEDHRDLRRAPFGFLGADDDYKDGQCDSRGNRLRASDWMAIARTVPGAQVEAAGGRVKRDAVLPEPLDAKFAGYAADDLKTATMLLLLRRPSQTA